MRCPRRHIQDRLRQWAIPRCLMAPDWYEMILAPVIVRVFVRKPVQGSK